MTDQKRVLIIGETPERIDFSDPAIPKGVTPEKIRAGLDSSVNELRAKGWMASILYVDDAHNARRQLNEAEGWESFDVVVVGAGLRIVPRHTPIFEVVINFVHERAPQAKLAFNLSPEDSANAAERVLSSDF